MDHTDIKKTFKEVSESKTFKVIISVCGALIIAAVIFEAGLFVGFHRAAFGRDWNDNYSKNFNPGHGPRMLGGEYDRLPNAHGAVGKIIKAELPTIIVLDKDSTEKVVLINTDTRIRGLEGDGSTADLKIDSYVVVIGSPNAAGQIEAKFIRIVPGSPASNPVAPQVPPATALPKTSQ